MDEQLIEEFNTRDPQGGVVRLYVYQQIIRAGTFQDPHATIPGLKRIETEDGDAVNFIDDQTFVRVATGKTLKRGV